MATIFRSPVITKIEPASRWEAIRAIAGRTSLALLTAAAPPLPPGTTDDFQNPIIKVGYENRTFLHRDTNTLGSTPVLPPPNYDYPNPRAYQREIGLLSFALPEFGPLIFQIGAPFVPIDFPNPLPPRSVIDRFVFIDGSLDLITLATAPLPKNTEAHTPPRGYSRPLDLHNYTYNPVNLIGASPTTPATKVFDYPNPIPPKVIPSAIKTETTTNFSMLVTTPASVNYDFPNPRGKPTPLDSFTWTQSPDVPTDLIQPPCTWVTFQPTVSPWMAINAQSDNIQPSAPLTQSMTLMPPAIWVGHYAPTPYSVNALSLGNQPLVITASAAANPTFPVDQPNPRGAQGVVDLRSYSNNLLENTLIPVFPPRGNLDFANPALPRRVVDLLSEGASLLPQLVPSVVPVVPVDQPNPFIPLRSVELRTHLVSLINNTLTPIFPNILNYDFPNPPGYAYPVALRTYLFSKETAPDTFFGIPGQPPANLDWPVPKGPQQPVEHKAFANNGILETVLFNVAYQPQTFDYPNPKGYRHPIDSFSWAQNLLQYQPAQTAPFNYTGWENPKGYTYPSDLRTFALSPQTFVLIPTPAFPTIVDNPRGPSFSAEFLSFYQNLQENTLGGGALHNLVNTDFPNPIVPQFPSFLRTHLTFPDFNPNTAFGAEGQGLANYDWPNPIRPTYSIDLKTTAHARAAIYGIVIQPPANLDWPVPKGAVYSLFIRVHGLGLMTTTLNPGPPPPSSLYPDHISVSSIRIALS